MCSHDEKRYRKCLGARQRRSMAALSPPACHKSFRSNLSFTPIQYTYCRSSQTEEFPPHILFGAISIWPPSIMAVKKEAVETKTSIYSFAKAWGSLFPSTFLSSPLPFPAPRPPPSQAHPLTFLRRKCSAGCFYRGCHSTDNCPQTISPPRHLSAGLPWGRVREPDRIQARLRGHYRRVVRFVPSAGGTEKDAPGLGPFEVADVVKEGVGADVFYECGGRGAGVFDGEEDRREERA